MKKLILSIITLFALSFSINAQNVNIPDANFKAYLVGNTSINTNSDTEIQISEANAFTGQINCGTMGITDMTGLEAFISVTDLRCHSNSISSLDVSQNTALTILGCANNNISTLDLTTNTTLTILNCGNNNLSSLDVSFISGLNSLKCYTNELVYLNVANGNNSNFTLFQSYSNPSLACIQVDNVSYSTTNWTNIDVASSFNTFCTVPCFVNIPDANFKAYLVGNTSINTNGDTEIQCSEASSFTGMININGASISDLTGLEAFTSMTTLSCNDNGFTSLDVSANTALEDLYCGYNNISSLDVSNNTNLENIECTNNNMSSLVVPTNNALTFINIIDNNFTSFDFSDLTALEGFRCSGNQFTSLDLSLLSSLNQLYCENNNLTSLDISNGNNMNFMTSPGGAYRFSASSNPNLTCIQVDDAVWSTTNFTDIDATASFSENCTVLVNSISVDGQGSVSTIITNGGTLQMEATVLPLNADDASYTWSVTNGTGLATIDANGLLTASADGTVEVTARANDASGETGTKTITISNQSVGINDISFENLSIYPNPTNGIVNLKIEEELSSIKLFDLTGKMIQIFNPNNTQLDVSDLTTGIYFLEVANTEKKSVIKLIKK